jgi:cap2 methyltransferase
MSVESGPGRREWSLSEGIKTGGLPLMHRWLHPKYFGFGDLITRIASKQSSGITDPRNWKKDFPMYRYGWTELLELKTRLNACKRQLDPYQDSKRYSLVTDMIRLHDDLRGPSGLVVRKFGGEIVTNAWLKMYELCKFLTPLLPTGKRNKRINSFHIAEAPGNFMLAINHFFSQYDRIEWSWHANTYRTDGDASTYLSDQYGLISAYSDRWLWGADGNGDITSEANIRSFRRSLRDPIMFITSDVKYVPEVVSFDEEENINVPVHFGHTLTSLALLEKGGIAILKEFTFFEAQSISLLWILTHCFKDVSIVKPITSRPANSEVYLVCTGYKKNLTDTEMARLFDILRYIRSMNTEDGSPAIFLQDDIPTAFVNRVVNIMTELVDEQCNQINRNLELFKAYNGMPMEEIKSEFSSSRHAAATSWLDMVHMVELSSTKKMMK